MNSEGQAYELLHSPCDNMYEMSRYKPDGLENELGENF